MDKAISSGFDVNFSASEFLQLQDVGLHPEFRKSIEEGRLEISTDGTLSFDLTKPRILGFVMKEDSVLVGTCYVFPEQLFSYRTLIKTASGFEVTTLGELAHQKFPELNQYADKLYLLDLGGDFILPNYQGRGFYSELFAKRWETLKEGISDGALKVYDEVGDLIPYEYLVLGLVSMGNFKGNEFLKTLLLGKTYSEGELTMAGIDPAQVGIPRSDSIASQKLAERYGMREVGVSSANLGPIYISCLIG